MTANGDPFLPGPTFADRRDTLRLAQAIGEAAPVRYPGLPGDPAHETAKAQMDRFGPVLCFTSLSATWGTRWRRHSVALRIEGCPTGSSG